MASTSTKLSLTAAAAVALAAIATKEGGADGHWRNRLAGLRPVTSGVVPDGIEGVRRIAMSRSAGVARADLIQRVVGLGVVATPVLTQIINDSALPVNNRLFAIAAFGASASKNPEVAEQLMSLVSSRTNTPEHKVAIGDVSFTDGKFSVTNHLSFQNTNNVTFDTFASRHANAAVDKALFASLANLTLNSRTINFLTGLYESYEAANARAIGTPTSSFYNLPVVAYIHDKLREYIPDYRISSAADGMMHVSSLLFGSDARMCAVITFAPENSYLRLMVNNIVIAPYDPAEPSFYNNATHEKMFNFWLSNLKPPYISGKPNFDQSDYLNILIAVANHCRRTGNDTIQYTPAGRALISEAVAALKAPNAGEDEEFVKIAERSLQ